MSNQITTPRRAPFRAAKKYPKFSSQYQRVPWMVWKYDSHRRIFCTRKLHSSAKRCVFIFWATLDARVNFFSYARKCLVLMSFIFVFSCNNCAISGSKRTFGYFSLPFTSHFAATGKMILHRLIKNIIWIQEQFTNINVFSCLYLAIRLSNICDWAIWGWWRVQPGVTNECRIHGGKQIRPLFLFHISWRWSASRRWQVQYCDFLTK